MSIDTVLPFSSLLLSLTIYFTAKLKAGKYFTARIETSKSFTNMYKSISYVQDDREFDNKGEQSKEVYLNILF